MLHHLHSWFLDCRACTEMGSRNTSLQTTEDSKLPKTESCSSPGPGPYYLCKRGLLLQGPLVDNPAAPLLPAGVGAVWAGLMPSRIIFEGGIRAGLCIS